MRKLRKPKFANLVIVVVALLALALVALLLKPSPLGMAPGPACAATLTNDTTLDGNLTCSGNGLTISADNVTLDCAGFSIKGSRSASYDGIIANNRKNVTIKNCIVSDFNQGIYFNSSSFGGIDNNVVHDNLQNGIELVSSTNSSITDNTGYNNYYTISLDTDSNNNNVINNTAYSNRHSGIIISYSSYTLQGNNTVMYNTAYNNTEVGVFFAESSYGTAAYNTVYANNVGIHLEYSTNDSILYNNATNNNGGILIGFNNYQNSVTGNIANSNRNEGIYLYSDSSNNTIANNIANNNTYGLRLSQASIYNSFVNNTANSNSYAIHIANSNYNTVANGTICYNNIPLYNNTATNTIRNSTFCIGLISGPADGSTIVTFPSNVSVNITNPIFPTSCILDVDNTQQANMSTTDPGIINNNITIFTVGSISLVHGYHNWVVECSDSTGSNGRLGINFVIDYCGDGTCGGGETCSSCPADCGACSPPPPPGGPGSPAFEQFLPIKPPTEQQPAVILPAETGEYYIPSAGASMSLEGPVLKSLEPPPAGAAYLKFEAAGTVKILKLEKIPDPTKIATLPEQAIPLNSWEITLEGKGTYFCRDFADVADIDPASVSVYSYDDSAWVQLPADKIILDMGRRTICGRITSTPYLIAGFTTAIVSPKPYQCPACPEPGEYGPCIDGQHSRLNYVCSASTNYTCQPVAEARYCVPQKLMPLVRVIMIIVGAFLVILLLWWVWLKQQVKPTLRRKK